MKTNKEKSVSFAPTVKFAESAGMRKKGLPVLEEEDFMETVLEEDTGKFFTPDSATLVAQSLLASQSVLNTLIDELMQEEVKTVEVDLKEVEDTMADSASRTQDKNKLPLSERVVRREDEHGNAYYTDTQSGMSAWSIEELLDPTEIEGLVASLDEYGNKYYLNTSTGTSAWTLEGLLTDSKTKLTEGIVEAIADDGKGTPYYYDTSTGQSAWTPDQLLNARRQVEGNIDRDYSHQSQFDTYHNQRRAVTTDAATQTHGDCTTKGIQTEDCAVTVKPERKRSSFWGIPAPFLIFIILFLFCVRASPSFLLYVLDSTIDFFHQSFQLLVIPPPAPSQ